MGYEITSKKHYHETMVTIYELMSKGEANLTTADTEKLLMMTTAAETFEDEVLGLKKAKQLDSLSEVIETCLNRNKACIANLGARI